VEAWEGGTKGDVVFASGVDSKLICLRREAGGSQWALAASTRAHTHDVTGLALVSQASLKGGHMPVLLSGGKDTKICSYPVESFAISRPRCVTESSQGTHPTPQTPPQPTPTPLTHCSSSSPPLPSTSTGTSRPTPTSAWAASHARAPPGSSSCATTASSASGV
jgi:hypothetical protein